MRRLTLKCKPKDSDSLATPSDFKVYNENGIELDLRLTKVVIEPGKLIKAHFETIIAMMDLEGIGCHFNEDELKKWAESEGYKLVKK